MHQSLLMLAIICCYNLFDFGVLFGCNDCRCREEEKDAYLYYILSVHGQGRTIVFCTSIAALRHISALLRILGVHVWTLHAQMQQRARLKVCNFSSSLSDVVLGCLTFMCSLLFQYNVSSRPFVIANSRSCTLMWILYFHVLSTNSTLSYFLSNVGNGSFSHK